MSGGLERGLSLPSFLRKEKPGPETELYERILKAYRAWNVREKGSIIDFDLTAGPDDFEEVSKGFSQVVTSEDRSHMVGVIGKLLEAIDDVLPISKDPDRHNMEFLKARLDGSLWLNLRLLGEALDPMVYLEKTNGERIEQTKDEVLLPIKN